MQRLAGSLFVHTVTRSTAQKDRMTTATIDGRSHLADPDTLTQSQATTHQGQVGIKYNWDTLVGREPETRLLQRKGRGKVSQSV